MQIRRLESRCDTFNLPNQLDGQMFQNDPSQTYCSFFQNLVHYIRLEVGSRLDLLLAQLLFHSLGLKTDDRTCIEMYQYLDSMIALSTGIRHRGRGEEVGQVGAGDAGGGKGAGCGAQRREGEKGRQNRSMVARWL